MSLFSRTKNTPPPKKPADYALFRQSPSDQTPQTPSDDIIDVQPTETPSPTPASSPFNQTPTPATSDSPSSNASNTFFSAKPTTPSQPDQPASSSDAKKPSRFSLPPLFKAKPKPASTSTTPPPFAPATATPAAKNTLLPFAILSVILALASAGARYYTQLSVDDLHSQITTLQNKMPAALASQITPWTDTSALFSAMETSAPSTYSYIATPKSINLSLTYPLQHPYTEYDFAPLDPANLPFLQNAAYPCHGSSTPSSSSTPTNEPASVSLTLSCIPTTATDLSSSSASTPTSP